jgi:thiazole synthase ThiGH ThiG subunit
MIRTKGEAGTGDVVEAVRHARTVLGEIRRLQNMPDEELMTFAKEIGAPYELVKETKELGRLPVVNFAAGGIATPADAALMMQLGVDGVFVGSGIFKSGDPARRAKAIVEATTHYRNAEMTPGPRQRETWASRWSACGNGFTELASDTTIDNNVSLASHLALGFTEVERQINFIKKLNQAGIFPETG